MKHLHLVEKLGPMAIAVRMNRSLLDEIYPEFERMGWLSDELKAELRARRRWNDEETDPWDAPELDDPLSQMDSDDGPPADFFDDL